MKNIVFAHKNLLNLVSLRKNMITSFNLGKIQGKTKICQNLNEVIIELNKLDVDNAKFIY